MVAMRFINSFLVEESLKSPKGEEPEPDHEPDTLTLGSLRHNSIS